MLWLLYWSGHSADLVHIPVQLSPAEGATKEELRCTQRTQLSVRNLFFVICFCCLHGFTFFLGFLMLICSFYFLFFVCLLIFRKFVHVIHWAGCLPILRRTGTLTEYLEVRRIVGNIRTCRAQYLRCSYRIHCMPTWQARTTQKRLVEVSTSRAVVKVIDVKKTFQKKK